MNVDYKKESERKILVLLLKNGIMTGMVIFDFFHVCENGIRNAGALYD